MSRAVGFALSLALAAAPFAAWSETPAPRDPGIRSATEFLSPELAGEQQDGARNRGMLWVEEGRRLWSESPGAASRSCAGCHGEAAASMRGVAARYPAIDRATGKLLNLEARINVCRTRHQSAPPLAYDFEPLLSLTALIAFLSRGLPLAVAMDGAAAPHLAAGRSFFETRQGQLDLACRQCHVENVGRRLRGDTISSGIGTGYPAYRLEWQGLGSLYRRLKACQVGMRAEEFAPDSPEHLALELYLAWRARGHPVETPGLRR
jgi:sulfur-oxidizing protein SoxA